MVGQAGGVLGGRAEPGQHATAVIEPGPGHRPEHGGGIPPAHDPDVKPAGQDAPFARPAVIGLARLERAGDDRVRQPQGVRRRNGDNPRFGHHVGEFQVDRVRHGGQHLAGSARPAQYLADGQAGHPRDRQRRSAARAGADPMSSAACPGHARHSTGVFAEIARIRRA